jgi:hypothetical protein
VNLNARECNGNRPDQTDQFPITRIHIATEYPFTKPDLLANLDNSAPKEQAMPV